MPGTYAPPAVELPKTSAIVGCLRADERVRSRKSRPPGMKISFCVGRSAPPDSTSEIVGRLFSSAICEARKIFLTVQGLLAPPFTVGSLALIMHSTPSTTPMPVTTDAPTVKSEPQPASGDSSRKAEPGSTSSSIRSRAVSLPRAWWRSTYFSPPPATATACCASRSASFSSIAVRLVEITSPPPPSSAPASSASPCGSCARAAPRAPASTARVGRLGSMRKYSVTSVPPSFASSR